MKLSFYIVIKLYNIVDVDVVDYRYNKLCFFYRKNFFFSPPSSRMGGQFDCSDSSFFGAFGAGVVDCCCGASLDAITVFKYKKNRRKNVCVKKGVFSVFFFKKK